MPCNLACKSGSGDFPFEMNEAADYLEMLASGSTPKDMLAPLCEHRSCTVQLSGFNCQWFDFVQSMYVGSLRMFPLHGPAVGHGFSDLDVVQRGYNLEPVP